MGFTRRAVLAMEAFLGLVGCSDDAENTPPGSSSPHKGTLTEGISRYFNDNDELTTAVNNERTDSSAVSIGAGVRLPHTISLSTEPLRRYSRPSRDVPTRGEGVGRKPTHTYQQQVGTRRMACQWPLMAPSGPPSKYENSARENSYR